MPIYEYKCEDCNKKSSFLILNINNLPEIRCKSCGSSNMKKIISRVAVIRSEESRLESLADPSKFSDFDERDPKSIAKWMKKMGKEMGEDFGNEIEEAMEEASKEEKKESNQES
ncbi:MAG: zinc ribbon domain-containing protein [Acidobacteriota bacterium]